MYFRFKGLIGLGTGALGGFLLNRWVACHGGG